MSSKRRHQRDLPQKDGAPKADLPVADKAAYPERCLKVLRTAELTKLAWLMSVSHGKTKA